MLLIFILFVSMIIHVEINNAHDVIMKNSLNTTVFRSLSNNEILSYRGIDETMLDRDWDRYLYQLKRLKLPDNNEILSYRGIDETMLDRDWARYLYQLKRLKLPDNNEILSYGGIDETMLDRDWARYLYQLKRLKLPDNNEILSYRGIDETMLDRDWDRYLYQLKRLKLPDNNEILSYRGIDETMLDRDWARYLYQLKRLKLPEMKKTLRSRVRSGMIHPYFPLKQIRRRLELLKFYDPDNVEVGHVKILTQGNSIYRTFSGQGILYVKISESYEGDKNREGNIVRPIVVLVAGIGGSDWMAVQAIMHVITNLVTSYDEKKLSGYDWWIIPVLNPDGYINSMNNRMSRFYKTNINPSSGCSGVNLDRNFLLQRIFCRDGREIINCQEHPGEYPFSERESCALHDFIYPRMDHCKVFVALKEGARALVYPFATTLSSPPGPHSVLQDLLCAEALEVFDEFQTGTKEPFQFGNSGSIFGPSSGYVEDWAKRHMGIPRSFAFYLGKRAEREKVPVREIEEFGKKTLKALKVLANSRRFEPHPQTFQELIDETEIVSVSKYHKSRPIPWGRELMDENLRQKIIRGAKLEMPMEFMIIQDKNRYGKLDYPSTNS